MSAKKLIKIIPESLIQDERSAIYLAVFREALTEKKFSINIDRGGQSLSPESFDLSLSKAILESFDYTCDLAIIKDSEKVSLFIKPNEQTDLPLKEINLDLISLLSLWNLNEFDIFASKEFIENLRDQKMVQKSSKVNFSNPHKKYGQRYLS